MKKYKVCVYAISKNEEKFVKRWLENLKEADNIYVLDTGSTDNTVKLLEENGAIVQQKIIKPWRFDTARNLSLELVPLDTDICVCLDLDEVITAGWRAELERIWDEDTTRLAYNYNWSFDEYGKPATSFYIEKIHSRKDYTWTHPVHEVLTYKETKREVIKICETIVVNHYPDDTKSRSSYLPLLEMSVREDPEDDRNMHYLGREYMFYKKYHEAIDTLIKHLNLKRATWKDERCASMRFIARCYTALERYDEARMWLDKAIKEAPYLREPYVELSFLEYKLSNWTSMRDLLLKALEIKERGKSYINENFCWDSTIYENLAIAYYYLGDKENSLKNIDIAMNMNPNLKRIKDNKEIIEKL